MSDLVFIILYILALAGTIALTMGIVYVVFSWRSKIEMRRYYELVTAKIIEQSRIYDTKGYGR